MSRDAMTETDRAGGAGRILAVDDNRLNRLTLERALQQEGHDVCLAESGEQALELLEHDAFDVVLLDILMPGMDGYAVLKRIKADPATRDIPVIVISALDDIDSAVRCIEMGAEDYLPKPFNAVLLRARLNACLQRKKLRDMEKTYLQQEVMLRQSERLATLGKLSAGMAHELNNPAAAALRGARQLAEALDDLEKAFRGVGALPADPNRDAVLERVIGEVSQAVRSEDALNALDRAERVSEVEASLERAGAEEPWDVAPVLVDAGYTVDLLEEILHTVEPSHLPPILKWLSASALSRSLLDEIVIGAGRISELVSALKGYTYLDRAPLQEVNVHEGLDSTLIILRNKLKQGVRVRRAYADGLPPVPAYGSELNQVWTNLLDNAIDAMGGEGDLTIETRHDDVWVVVSIEDTGPGIPEHVRPHLFDPFFTTKAPGSGTGLGLNISHAIVVDKHDGRIDVDSVPGRTRFDVWLPRERADADAGPESGDLDGSEPGKGAGEDAGGDQGGRSWASPRS